MSPAFAVCIIMRLLLVYGATRLEDHSGDVAAAGRAAALVSVGFLVAFATRRSAFESSQPGGRVWWNHLRPLHALLYGAFAWGALVRGESWWGILALDVLIGVIAHRTILKN